MFLKAKLSQRDLAGVLSQYSSAYYLLVNFFSTCEKFKPIASLVPIPKLSINPPQIASAMNIRPPTSNLPPQQMKRKRLTGTSFEIENDADSDLDEDEQSEIDSIPTLTPQPLFSNETVTMDECLKVEGNDICADCSTKFPKWASINIGVFICTNCSGLHRGLGVHISQVRSVSLDNWTSEQIHFMRTIGNVKANQYWEATMPPERKTFDIEDKVVVEQFIRDKYEKKLFIPKIRLVKKKVPSPMDQFVKPQLLTPTPIFPQPVTPTRSPIQQNFGFTQPMQPRQQQFRQTPVQQWPQDNRNDQDLLKF